MPAITSAKNNRLKNVGIETSIDHVDNREIDRRAHAVGQRWRRFRRMSAAFGETHAPVRGSPSEQLEQQRSDGVHVGLCCQSAAGELFRRHVCRRAGNLPGLLLVCEARKAEIGNPHLAAAVEHHVGRLQVTMEDTAIVGRSQTGTHLPHDLDGFVRGEPPDASKERREILAVHILHRHERPPVPLADVMHTADVGMRHLARGTSFLA
jgi:hypothetical protein